MRNTIRGLTIASISLAFLTAVGVSAKMVVKLSHVDPVDPSMSAVR